MTSQPRLADLLSALSQVSDLGMGLEPEEALRVCSLATSLGRELDVDEKMLSDVYYTALLQHSGCTGHAYETALALGDDVAVNRVGFRTNFADPWDLVRTYVPGLVEHGALGGPLRTTVAVLARSTRTAKAFPQATCEVAAETARRLGLGDGVQQSLLAAFEWWNGKGGPRGLRAEEIPLPTRLVHVAAVTVLFHGIGGVDAALAALRARSGGYLDPALVDAALVRAPRLLADIDVADCCEAVLEQEPAPQRLALGESGLDEVAAAFGDIVDLKTPWLHGHSRGVAELAYGAATVAGLDAPMLRRAGLLHDVGRAGVSAAVWAKAGPLRTTEWEQVRLHPYHAERMLTRSAALAPLARLVGMHHERQDASGYHRGATGRDIPLEARILAAADVFHALTESRPYRGAFSSDRAAEFVRAEARAGRLDGDAVSAVLDARAGASGRRRVWPAGLTDRQVEVLRLVAQGLSNKEIARRLVVSPRTAEHHVQDVYLKIGVASRAGAALFALEHGLL
jgi:HD-GYP domain-containing protein (c-di-GMP phosphodiesterase class II)/DNA-binding CsgD family transcriptional regulator